MAATKEQIRQAAMEMHGRMQQRAIARLQGELPARSQSKVGVRSEEREEMLRRFPQFTREDRSKVVKELQRLVKAAIAGRNKYSED